MWAAASAGDLAEIAMLCAREHDVEIVGIIDATLGQDSFLGLPVAREAASLGVIDAAVITELAHPQGAYEAAVALLGAERALAPDFLRIRRQTNSHEAAP